MFDAKATISLQDKRSILEQADFGQSAAEFDRTLQATFIETATWHRLVDDRINNVYGAKGSGKSAIAVFLNDRSQDLRRRHGIVIVNAESPDTIDPVFQVLNERPPLTLPQLAALWKLYLLTLLGDTLRTLNLRDTDAQTVVTALEQSDLLPREAAPPLERMLQRALDYVTGSVFVEGSVGIPATPITARGGVEVVLHEPTAEQRARGVRMISLQELLLASGRALERAGLKIWFVLDRLDVAFSKDEALEARALKGLFHTSLTFSPKAYRLKLKIFLRPDIWERIAGQFAEEDERERFSQATAIQGDTILWDVPTLRSLFMRRLTYVSPGAKKHVRGLYHVNTRKLADSAQEQDALFARIFPSHLLPVHAPTSSVPQPRSPLTFPVLLDALRDGTGQVAPRMLVLLLTYSQSAQLRRIASGAAELSGDQLFEPEALEEALNEVSRFQLFQTLYSEYPHLQKRVERFRGGTSRFNSQADLEGLWEMSATDTQRTIALLVYLGVLAPIGEVPATVTAWEVPRLYRRALALRA